jgi:hypothetical protein
LRVKTIQLHMPASLFTIDTLLSAQSAPRHGKQTCKQAFDAAWWGRVGPSSDAQLFIYRFLCCSCGHGPHLCPGSYRAAGVRIAYLTIRRGRKKKLCPCESCRWEVVHNLQPLDPLIISIETLRMYFKQSLRPIQLSFVEISLCF